MTVAGLLWGSCNASASVPFDFVIVRHRDMPRSTSVVRARIFSSNEEEKPAAFFAVLLAAPLRAGSLELGTWRLEARGGTGPFSADAGSPLSAALLARWRWCLRSLRESRGTAYSFKALAPPMISINSVVIAACRARLYCRVSRSMISDAFFVAESMAVMRAPNSDAIDS